MNVCLVPGKDLQECASCMQLPWSHVDSGACCSRLAACWEGFQHVPSLASGLRAGDIRPQALENLESALHLMFMPFMHLSRCSIKRALLQPQLGGCRRCIETFGTLSGARPTLPAPPGAGGAGDQHVATRMLTMQWAL